MIVALASPPTEYRARPTCNVQERGHWSAIECRALAVVEVTVEVDDELLDRDVCLTYGICAEHLRRMSAGENQEIA